MDPNNQQPPVEEAVNEMAVGGNSNGEGSSSVNRETISDGSTTISTVSLTTEDDLSYAINNYMEHYQATANEPAAEAESVDASVDTSSDCSLKVHPGSQSSLNLDLILASNSGQMLNNGEASTSRIENGKGDGSSCDSTDADDSSELS